MGSAIMSQNRGMLAFDKDIKKMKVAKKCYKARAAFDISDLIKESNVVILAVKPQDINFVLEEIRSVYQKELIISIAAGIATKYIEDKISGVRVIRVMPNIAVQVKSGISAMCKGRFARNSDLTIAKAIFKKIGKVVPVKENDIDAFTAIAGSGPAYFFYFIEALSDAGRRLGFQEQQMADFVIEVAKGSIKLLVESKLSAKELREKVTSKGGTTEAALNVFKHDKFNQIVREAVLKATERARELSRG